MPPARNANPLPQGRFTLTFVSRALATHFGTWDASSPGLLLAAPAAGGALLANWCLRRKQTLSFWGSTWGGTGQDQVCQQSDQKAKVPAVCRIKGKVSQPEINSRFERGEVWLCSPNSVQNSVREKQKKNSTGGVIFSWYLQPKASCYQKSSETHWVRNRREKKGSGT